MLSELVRGISEIVRGKVGASNKKAEKKWTEFGWREGGQGLVDTIIVLQERRNRIQAVARVASQAPVTTGWWTAADLDYLSFSWH